jgi:hypothetical protein
MTSHQSDMSSRVPLADGVDCPFEPLRFARRGKSSWPAPHTHRKCSLPNLPCATSNSIVRHRRFVPVRPSTQTLNRQGLHAHSPETGSTLEGGHEAHAYAFCAVCCSLPPTPSGATFIQLSMTIAITSINHGPALNPEGDGISNPLFSPPPTGSLNTPKARLRYT